MAHTKGKWFARRNSSFWEVDVNQSNGYADETHCPCVAHAWAVSDEPHTNTEQEEAEACANAHLIAAAPELLVALRGLVEQIESLEGYQLTRDIDSYKAQANFDDALATAGDALKRAEAAK